jgi:sortase A
MRVARVIGAVGRVMITTGVLLILFVAFQLWGTGLQESRAQSSLERDFTEMLDERADVEPTAATAPTTVVAPAPTVPAPTVPAPTVPAPTVTRPPLPAYVPGDAIARIEMPKIGVDKIVVEGVQLDDLRKGPGRYRSTSFPGQPGNAAIAGHRTTYGAPFADVDQLEPGDEIIVTTIQGRFTYRVMPQTNPTTGAIEGHRIVLPTEVWVLEDAGDNRLTLTACHPKFSAAQRIVVQALLEEPPAPPAPAAATGAPPSIVDETTAEQAPSIEEAVGDADLAQGLSGDQGHLVPAILFGALTAAVLVGIGAASRRFGRLPAYATGAVPVLFVVLSLFEHLDRLLPVR